MGTIDHSEATLRLWGNSNDGLLLSAKAMLALGQRGIALGLDIYEDDDPGKPAEP